MEEWVKIEWADSHYVSNLGRVRTTDKVVKNWPKGFRTVKGRIIKPWIRNGYPCVGISGKTVYVHRLVAEYFVAGRRDDLDEVNHKDGDKSNPKHTNLEWTNHAGNMQHAANERLFGFMRPIIRSEDSLGVCAYYPSASCVKDHGFKRSNVAQNLSGLSKSAYGFTWEYVFEK